MTLFDTHAHFDTFAAEGRVDSVLARAREAGVARMCAVGSSGPANELVVRLAREHPEQLVAAVGYDRDQVAAPRDPARLAALATAPGVVAIGEVGLDYYYSAETAPAQRDLFGAMLAGAAALRKPVIVHSRDADDDTIAMLGEFSTVWKKLFHTVEKKAATVPHCGKNGPDFSTPWKTFFHSVENQPPAAPAALPPPPGVLHCFTGDAAFAAELVALGFLISFSGIVSFNNAAPLREVARQIPADHLLVETDCPYLTPQPFRGKVNEPAYVARVADVVATARGVSAAAVAELTWANACRLFQMEG